MMSKRRRSSCTVAMMARALKAGKLAGVPVAVTWDAAAERLTVFPCGPVSPSSESVDPLSDAIAKFTV